MTVERRLAEARQARLNHQGDRVLELLREAWDAVDATDPTQQRSTAWRYAKAAYDFGTPDTLLTALRSILQLDQPFVGYPQGLRAVAPMSQRIWDHLGYPPEVLALWQHYADAQRQANDPYLAAMGEVHQAWHLICTGEIDAAWSICERYTNLSARRFGRGPTKHPEAEDATLSLYWVQADLARTVLRGATWDGRERMALDALDVYDDAMAFAQRSRHQSFWYVDPVCRAADRFGWQSSAFAGWPRLLNAVESVHPVHFHLGRALVSRRAGRPERCLTLLAEAERQARVHHAGFEWQIDALIETSLTAGSTPAKAIEDAKRVALGSGVRAFAHLGL